MVMRDEMSVIEELEELKGLEALEPAQEPEEAGDEIDKKIDEIMSGNDEEALKELKIWLFKENIRMNMLRNELKETQEVLEIEKKRFAEEMRSHTARMERERKLLEQENRFFDQKMKILQGGFEQLDADRRKFQKEKDKFVARKEIYKERDFGMRNDTVEMLFRGVNSFLALKKRYKDLMKMFHPDNVAGDHEMVQLINREYEELKKAYEVGRQA